MPSITIHAFEHYQKHHPRARYRDVRRALREGYPVTGGEAFDLASNNPLHVKYHGQSCTFILSPDGLGLFVIRPHKGEETGRPIVVTYLRLPTGPGRRALIRSIQARGRRED